MSTTLTQKTMRRVYAIWVARVLVSPIFLKLYAIVALLFGMTRYVSVRDVLSNAPAWNDFGAQYTFLTSAITHTEMAMLGMTLGFFFCALWIGFDVATKKTA